MIKKSKDFMEIIRVQLNVMYMIILSTILISLMITVKITIGALENMILRHVPQQEHRDGLRRKLCMLSAQLTMDPCISFGQPLVYG